MKCEECDIGLPNEDARSNHAPELDRDDWLAWRKGGIGASEIAGVLGLSPWQTPMSIYLNKLDLVADTGENEAMRWGNLLEPLIADTYEDMTGHQIVGRQLLCWDRVARHRRCTLDGILKIGNVHEATVQIKTTKHEPWDELPDNYALQVQYELGITGYPYAIVPTLHHGNRLVTYRVEADPELQRIIFEAADRFWFDHIEPRVPPAMDGYDSTTQALRQAFPQHNDDVLHAVDGSGLDELIQQYIEAQQRTAEAEGIEKALANELRGRLEAKQAIVDGQTGAEYVTYRTQTSRRLDQKRIKEEHPELAEQYMSESTSRVLRVTKQAINYYKGNQQ